MDTETHETDVKKLIYLKVNPRSQSMSRLHHGIKSSARVVSLLNEQFPGLTFMQDSYGFHCKGNLH